MFLRAACVFVVLALVSAFEPGPDDTNALKIKYFRPNTEDNPSDFLKVKCSIDITRVNWVGLTKLKLYISDTGDEDDYQALASVTKDKLTYGMNRKQIFAKGKYHITTDYRTKLKIRWVSEEYGWCTYYKCVATGRDPNNGKLLGIYKTQWVDAAEGETCDKR